MKLKQTNGTALDKNTLLVNKWQVFVVNFRLAGAFCILGLDC